MMPETPLLASSSISGNRSRREAIDKGGGKAKPGFSRTRRPGNRRERILVADTGALKTVHDHLACGRLHAGEQFGRVRGCIEGCFGSRRASGYDCAQIRPPWPYKEEETVAFDEKTLTKEQTRKLNALRKSVGDKLGEEVFGKWLVQQAAAGVEPKRDVIAVKIEESLAQYAGDRSFRLGNYGYTIRRTRGKGRSGFVARKNEKP